MSSTSATCGVKMGLSAVLKASVKKPFSASTSTSSRGKNLLNTSDHSLEKKSNGSGTSCSSKRRNREQDQKRQNREQSDSIDVTNTARERMRNVSVLTLDIDDFPSQPKRNFSLQSSDSEGKRTLNTAVSGQTDNDVTAGPIERTRSIPVEEDHQVSPWPCSEWKTKPTEFAFPSALVSPESEHRRSESFDENACLVEIETILPPRVDQKHVADMNAFDETEECSDNESHKQPQITRRGMEVRGFVAPTSRQRQLMRKVSGLGMEDPVFGDSAEQLRPSHASNIFDDMDIGDVPDDMKDMLTLASDHTDAVDQDDDIFESPVQQKARIIDEGIAFSRSWCAIQDHQKSCTGLPTLGLDPAVSPKRDVSSQRPPVFKRAAHDDVSPPSPPPLPIESSLSTGNFRKSGCESPLPHIYTPPAGSFVHKKVSKESSCRTPSRANLQSDDRLAARVDAMFQKSLLSLKSPQRTCKTPSPRRSRSKDIGGNFCDAASKFESQLCTGSRRVSTASVYVPPGLPPKDKKRYTPVEREHRRALPSMDSVFRDTVPAAAAAPARIPNTISINERRSPARADNIKSHVSRLWTPKHGFPPYFSTPRSKKLPNRGLPPSMATSSSRKYKGSHNDIIAPRRGTGSTTNMSPSSLEMDDMLLSLPVLNNTKEVQNLHV